MTERLVLLDPGFEIPPERALQGAEMGRLDWSFETPEGAVNALAASNGGTGASRSTVAAYVEDDLRRGADGRHRFSFCPAAVVAAWSEMCLPAPPIADTPTLVVCTESSAFTASLAERYRRRLGSKFSQAWVPNGHNVLWESREETVDAVECFLRGDRGSSPPAEAGYVDDSGAFQPLL
jgi:hypothetical protein